MFSGSADRKRGVFLATCGADADTCFALPTMAGHMLKVRDALAGHASFVRDGFLERAPPAGTSCSAPSCDGTEISFDDGVARRDVVDMHYRNRAVSSDVVHVAPAMSHSDLLLPSFLSDLCRRVDAELGAGLDCRARNHGEVCEMWQTFQEVAGSHDFRAAVRRHQATVLSPARPMLFEAILDKGFPPGGKSFGFVIHKAQAHRGVLFVDEIQLGGVLDVWNRHMHESGRTMYCVQPLAVIVSVNGVSGDHASMSQELMSPQAVLHVVNPPSVSAIVCVYDVLREGLVHPAPFWEFGPGTINDNSQSGAADAQWSNAAPRGGRQEPPEYSGERGVTCMAGKDRMCMGAKQMEECLEPPGVRGGDDEFRWRGRAQESAPERSAGPTVARRNMF